jgi:hypothetical protein
MSLATAPGREVLAATIARLQDRARHGRDTAGCYEDTECREVLLDAELWDGLATALQLIKSRAEIRLEDRAADKDGKPKFISTIRQEFDAEIAQIFAGALRPAFASGLGTECAKNAA